MNVMVQENLIRFSNVTFKYDENEPAALRDVSFNIQKASGHPLSDIMVQESLQLLN